VSINAIRSIEGILKEGFGSQHLTNSERTLHSRRTHFRKARQVKKPIKIVAISDLFLKIEYLLIGSEVL
jgi:hypothetical protein